MAFEGESKSSENGKLLLTAAVPASFEAIAAGYDVPELSKYLDYINVMTYDFHGQWENQVGQCCPTCKTCAKCYFVIFLCLGS